MTPSVHGEACPGCDDAIRPYDPVDLWGGRVWHRGCLDDWWSNEAERQRVDRERRAVT